jgi:anti-anti-sigma factor
LALSGDLGPDLVPGIEEVLDGLLRERTPRVVVDFEHVGHVASDVICVLVGYASRFRAHGLDLRLCAIPAKVQDVLGFLRRQELVAVFEDRAAALAAEAPPKNPD